jgi:putative nucleotidyltransferase with HDIG domain
MHNLNLEKFNLLILISGLVNSSLDIGEIRKRAVDSALKLLNAEAGSILLLDQSSGELFFDTAVGDKGEEVKTIRLKRGEGIAGWVVANRKAQIINDVQSDKRFYKEADRKSGFKTRNMICVPLMTKHRIIGALQVINKYNNGQPDAFTSEDLELLSALANQVAIAIENAQLYEELRETFYATIHALTETVEKRDIMTAGHTRRVTKYCMAIGKELSLSSKDMVNLKLASLLHDIGKIAVSDEILNNSSKLSYSEQHILKMHPLYGAEILSHIKSLKDVVPSVKHHHELFNGSGYPDRLRGDEIPLYARIISVADAFDLLIYQKGISRDEAIKEIKEKIWIEYDGEIVNGFLRALKKIDERSEI